jgi:hypothetical protein
MTLGNRRPRPRWWYRAAIGALVTTAVAGAIANPAEAAAPDNGSGAIGGTTAPQPPIPPTSGELAPMESADQATAAQEAAMTAAAARARSTKSPVVVDALTSGPIGRP